MTDSGGQLKDEEGLYTAAFNGLANVDDAVRYVTKLLFYRHRTLVLKYNLYPKSEDKSDRLSFVQERGSVPKAIYNLLKLEIAAVKATHSSPPISKACELDKDGRPLSHTLSKFLLELPCMPIAVFRVPM